MSGLKFFKFTKPNKKKEKSHLWRTFVAKFDIGVSSVFAFQG